MRADLHSHTIYSDGGLSVSDLIKRAKDNKVDILAITDHDCFEGAIEASNMNTDIRIIYGIELSTKSNGESIHVLGYYSKPLLEGFFFDYLKKQIENRRERAKKIVVLLKEKLNIELDDTFIYTINSVTRGTIASEIVKQGYASNIREAFKNMIGDSAPCYLPSTHLSTEDGIKMIKDSGGMPVLAHPCLYQNNDIESLIKKGVRGIEGVYPHTKDKETKFRDLAKKYNLLVTGGSDFHRIGNDDKHGDVGEAYIKDADLKKFLKVLEDEY